MRFNNLTNSIEGDKDWEFRTSFLSSLFKMDMWANYFLTDVCGSDQLAALESRICQATETLSFPDPSF